MRGLVPLAAAAVALAACGGEDATEAETGTPRETVTETVVETETVETDEGEGAQLAQRCESPEGGYAVRYPAGWHANEGDVTAACSFFHPEAFELPEATEPPPLAISISREPVPFARVTGDSPAIRVESSEQTEVAGRPAVRREVEATGDGLLPAGVRGEEYLVDLDGETLIASTHSRGELDFDENRSVLGRMVETLELR